MTATVNLTDAPMDVAEAPSRLDATIVSGITWAPAPPAPPAPPAGGPTIIPVVPLPPVKRVLDVVGAVALLLLTLPLLAAVAVAIRLQDGGPVLYRQRRVGLGGRTFEVLKLRTMAVGADSLAAQLAGSDYTDGLLFRVPADPRVTAVGAWLRRTAIDELPQLWNVLKGDMSLVGPRPLAVQPDDFTGEEHRRHAVKPGLTGAWQVSGGNDLTWDEMIQLDLEYAFAWSLAKDVTIMVMTVPALLFRRGPS